MVSIGKTDIIVTVFTIGHLRGAILETLSQSSFNRFTFLHHIHENSPHANKHTAVKPLRRKVFMLCLYVKVDRPLPCSLSTYHGKRAQLDKAAPLRIQISAALFSEEPAKINIFAKDMV